jgi:hypothetical protein
MEGHCERHLKRWWCITRHVGPEGPTDEDRTHANRLASNPILPMIALPVLTVWLTVHRELRSTALMRSVYDFLAREVPLALDS